MTIRTPPNAEHDLVGGINNNGGIGAGLDGGELAVPFFIHLLLDQFRGEGLRDQAVGMMTKAEITAPTVLFIEKTPYFLLVN